MLSLGLSGHEQREFHQALTHDHAIRITVHLTDLEGKIRADVSRRFIDGQVDVDSHGIPTRSLSMTLYDPNSAIGLDGDDPGDGAVTADTMVKVVYSVRVRTLGDWVDVPVFRGQVTGLSRDGTFLAVEAQGKEMRAMRTAGKPRTFKKGVQKVDVIAGVLRDVGELNRFLDIPPVGGRIPDSMTIGKMRKPWEFARGVARSMERQLFYDGRGVCRLRAEPQKPCFVFRTGNGGAVTSPPSFTYDADEIINGVWVLGKKKGKNRPEATRWLPRKHPQSKFRLGANGELWPNLQKVENDSVKSNKEADKVAVRHLNNIAREAVQTTFESMPVPHLDTGDMVRLDTGDVTTNFRLSSFSIPLTAGPSMSIGYTQRVSRPLVKRHHFADHHSHHGAPIGGPGGHGHHGGHHGGDGGGHGGGGHGGGHGD